MSILSWLEQRMEQNLRRKAEDEMMQRYGVSREYIQAIVNNLETSVTVQEWLCGAAMIARRYPHDTAQMGETHE